MLGNGKLHVGGTGVGGGGTGTDGGLELTGGRLNTDPEPPTTGPDEDAPDVCGEGPVGVVSVPADVPLEASAPDWLVVMGGATAPPQPAEARVNATDATQRDRDRRHFMSSI
jgi:hypothetical protein